MNCNNCGTDDDTVSRSRPHLAPLCAECRPGNRSDSVAPDRVERDGDYLDQRANERRARRVDNHVNSGGEV